MKPGGPPVQIGVPEVPVIPAPPALAPVPGLPPGPAAVPSMPRALHPPAVLTEPPLARPVSRSRAK